MIYLKKKITFKLQCNICIIFLLSSSNIQTVCDSLQSSTRTLWPLMLFIHHVLIYRCLRGWERSEGKGHFKMSELEQLRQEAEQLRNQIRVSPNTETAKNKLLGSWSPCQGLWQLGLHDLLHIVMIKVSFYNVTAKHTCMSYFNLWQNLHWSSFSECTFRENCVCFFKCHASFCCYLP